MLKIRGVDMGFGVGFDKETRRFIGYLVPAYCDHPDCNEEIDRGMAYMCPESDDGDGCGLFFCDKHRQYAGEKGFVCERCAQNLEPFDPKPVEHPDWVYWLLNHESWEEWRTENPEEVKRYREMWNSFDADIQIVAISNFDLED